MFLFLVRHSGEGQLSLYGRVLLKQRGYLDLCFVVSSYSRLCYKRLTQDIIQFHMDKSTKVHYLKKEIISIDKKWSTGHPRLQCPKLIE